MPKEGGGEFGPLDFPVGGAVRVYGRSLHVVDADSFTRATLGERGAPPPTALPYPSNPLDELRARRAKPSGGWVMVVRVVCRGVGWGGL